MSTLMELAERGILPDTMIRLGIRLLDRVRLRTEARPGIETELQAKQDFLARIRQSPVALVHEMANRQHYEVPPEFFQKVLGKNLKYSGCWWHRSARRQARGLIVDRRAPSQRLEPAVEFPFHAAGRVHAEPPQAALPAGAERRAADGQVDARGPDEAEIVPESPAEFYVKASPVRISFVPGRDGAPLQAFLSLMGLREFRMTRLP